MPDRRRPHRARADRAHPARGCRRAARLAAGRHRRRCGGRRAGAQPARGAHRRRDRRRRALRSRVHAARGHRPPRARRQPERPGGDGRRAAPGAAVAGAARRRCRSPTSTRSSPASPRSPRAHRVHVAGGNLTRSPGPLVIDVTVVGTVKRRQALTRGGARPGDDLYVSGIDRRGGAPGLQMLQSTSTSAAVIGVDGPCVAALSRTRSRASGLGAAARPQPRGDGLHGSQRRPRRRASTRSPRRAASASTIDAGALPIDAGARDVVRAQRRGCRSTQRSPAATTTSCCSPSRPRPRGRLTAAMRHGGVPLTRIGVCTGRRARVVLRGATASTTAPLPRGLQPLPMIHLTRSARPPLARRAAARRRHAGAHGRGVRARRVLRLLAVPRAAHAARRSSLAFLLNLNRVAVLLGVYSNLPWIIAGYYAFTTMMGAAILRTPLPPTFASASATVPAVVRSASSGTSSCGCSAHCSGPSRWARPSAQQYWRPSPTASRSPSSFAVGATTRPT